jgi:hypothetical protein
MHLRELHDENHRKEASFQPPTRPWDADVDRPRWEQSVVPNVFTPDFEAAEMIRPII